MHMHPSSTQISFVTYLPFVTWLNCIVKLELQNPMICILGAFNVSIQRNDFRWEFIRRAKAWREQKWPRCTGGVGRPSSYLLSLLVIKAYETAQKRVGVFSMLSPESLAYQ